MAAEVRPWHDLVYSDDLDPDRLQILTDCLSATNKTARKYIQEHVNGEQFYSQTDRQTN